MIQFLFAFIGGILTIAAPCILPVLPILLGSSVGQNNKTRPLFIVLGFVGTFALAGLILSLLSRHLPFINQNNVRTIAIFFIGVFGIFLLWPLPFKKLTSKFSGNSSRLAAKAGNSGSGLLLGAVLGLVWAPCAGPILAAILALIAAQGNTAYSALLLLAYALGAGIPMLIIAYGSQYATTKIKSFSQYAIRLQQIFGVFIILLAIAMYAGADVQLENKLANFFPQNTLENKIIGTQDVQDTSYGKAPEFTGIDHWLNLPDGKQTLSLTDLKGKVVLVDFWTYSCINCIRTLPYVARWYDTYKEQGLVVVGVHTPEFDFEKNTDNVQNAIGRYGIHYPVAQDNEYKTWNAYSNQFWPAEYLIDKNGNIAYTHFGEGNYDHTENTIRELLGLNQDPHAANTALGDIESPEMYFGTNRLQYLAQPQYPSQKPATYQMPKTVDINQFALGGTWQFDGEKAQLTQNNGSIKLHFSSGKVFMVASAGKPVTLHITVDGKPQPDVIVQASQLYTLFDSNDYKEHILDIQIDKAGLNAFTFTFG